MKISQREAQELKRRVAQLEEREQSRFSRWSTDYPNGVHIWSMVISEKASAAFVVARRLQHAIVCVPQDGGKVDFYALPAPRDTG